jgi:prefoldin subunit 5
MLGLGNNLNELKTRIQKLQQEIADLGQPSIPLENMIDATNTLRQNEFLAKSDSKKTELIAAYSEYVKNLEQITSSLFSIQAELKDLIKAEASLIESEPAPKKTKKPKKST